MRELQFTLPELAMVAGTRAILGAGLGLLLADRLPEGQRKAVGWTLFLIGAVSTLPLALEALGKAHDTLPSGWPEQGRLGLRSIPRADRPREQNRSRMGMN